MVHRSSGDSREFPDNAGASVETPLALDAMTAARYEEILFRKHIGRPAWLFKRRTFGPRCPHCWEERMQRARTKTCPSCHGSTYMHGYMSPIQFHVQIDPTTKEPQITSAEELQEEISVGRCTFFPPVSPRDVIVELENVRWRVVRLTATRRLRSPIHQEFQLRKIPPGHVEYTLPLDVDLETFRDQPGQAFVNPQNLSTAREGDRLSMGVLKSIYRWRTP
jgi:hypothetical protein